jgi:hypothetical protein
VPHSALEILPLAAILLVMTLHRPQTLALFGAGNQHADFSLGAKQMPRWASSFHRASPFYVSRSCLKKSGTPHRCSGAIYNSFSEGRFTVMFRVQESNRAHRFRDMRRNINFQTGHPSSIETKAVPAGTAQVPPFVRRR